MCWAKHNGRLAYMVGHCWTKFGFEGMQKIFPKSKIVVRYPNQTEDQVALEDLSYDSNCVRQRAGKPNGAPTNA